MSNLRSRSLSEEYLGILAELGGDAAGRDAAASYLASAHPVTHREGTPTWALSPKVLSAVEVGILREAAETMGRILDKVTRHYRDDADFRTRFGLPAELEALALVMARRLCLNHLRGANAATGSIDTSPRTEATSGETPESELISQEEAERAWRLMDSLPDAQQAVLRMKHVEGMEVGEIARVTGSSPEAVRQNLSRARRNIMKHFIV